MTAIALIFGAHLVLAIGGADMPVVVSMLNSIQAGQLPQPALLGNDLLIVTGAWSVPPARFCLTSCAAR